MKKILLFLFLFPALLYAQSEKYMAGAVPEVDGKVVFTREFNVGDFSEEQIMDALSEWCTRTFTGNSNRVLYTDREKSTIAVQGEDEMLVKIGLFPSKVKVLYMLTINCSDSNCTLTTSKVRYKNNPSSQNSNDIILAEEFITDKYALNKAKTKIFKGTGDYRIQTIEIVNRVASDAQNAVYAYYTAPAAQVAGKPAPRTVAGATAQTQQLPEQISQPVKTEQTTAAATGSTTMEIPEELIKAVAEKGLHVIAVGGRKLNNAIAGKGVINTSSGKASVMFTLDSNTDNILFLMEMADSYTLALLDGDNNARLLLNCKKSQQFDKTFIGEIVEKTIDK